MERQTMHDCAWLDLNPCPTGHLWVRLPSPKPVKKNAGMQYVKFQMTFSWQFVSTFEYRFFFGSQC